jgi:hypothetical protein
LDAAKTRRFKAHRALLAARVPYFKALFHSGLDDSVSTEITLADVSSEVKMMMDWEPLF